MAISDFEAEAWGTATDVLTGEPTIREQLLELAAEWESFEAKPVGSYPEAREGAYTQTETTNACGERLRELVNEILPE